MSYTYIVSAFWIFVSWAHYRGLQTNTTFERAEMDRNKSPSKQNKCAGF